MEIKITMFQEKGYAVIDIIHAVHGSLPEGWQVDSYVIASLEG